MNTWGASWGAFDCWGGSWGADDTVDTTTPLSGDDGPRGRTDFSDDELFDIAVAMIIGGVFDG